MTKYRQILLRSFGSKMPGIQDGKITAFLRHLNPQPQEEYQYHGTAFNGEEIFANGKGSYFFPRAIYHAGEITYVREDWAIRIDDGGPRYVYKAGWPADVPAQWKPAAYMPIEAVRFFLRIDRTSICRISRVTKEDAKSLGIGGQNWRRSLEAMWDADLKKTELQSLSFKKDPWVQIAHFSLMDRPDDWPTGISSEAFERGTSYKHYTIRLAESGEIIAQGTALECARAMGFKGPRSVYAIITRSDTGKRKYTVTVDASNTS